MSNLGRLNSALSNAALPREGAKPSQIEAFSAALDQVQSALNCDGARVCESLVAKTLFTKSLGAAVEFNRSEARLEHDPGQEALWLSIVTVEEAVKIPKCEEALIKAGVVKAVPHLLSVLLGTDDDVECREASVSCLIELMRQKNIRKTLQKTDFSDAAVSFSASSLLLQLNTNQLQSQVFNLMFLLGSRASRLRKEALLPYFESPTELAAADKAMHQGSMEQYNQMVATALQRLNATERTPITPVPAHKLNVFGKNSEGGCLFFGDTMLEIKLPGQEQYAIRLAKSINKFELKQVEKEGDAGQWKLALGVEKSKVQEHGGRLGHISCLLDTATANRLRERTIPALPLTVPIFEQEDEVVLSSNMSSGNGLLPPINPAASAAKKPLASAAKKISARATVKQIDFRGTPVVAKAKDPFGLEEFDDASGKAAAAAKAPAKAASAALKPATGGKATGGKKAATAANKGNAAVVDFPDVSSDGGGSETADNRKLTRESEVQRPAPKHPSQSALKQPASKQQSSKQPDWVKPAAGRSGPAKVFGRKSAPTALALPDLDDVFEFDPADDPLASATHKSTIGKSAEVAPVSRRDAVFGATGREAGKAVTLARRAAKEDDKNRQQQPPPRSDARKGSVLQPAAAHGQRKQQTKGSQAAARKAAVQLARQQSEEESKGRAKDFEEAQKQKQAHAPRVEKPSNVVSEAEEDDDVSGPRGAPTRSELERNKVAELQAMCKQRSVPFEKGDKKADLVDKLIDDFAVERQLATVEKSSKATPAAARRKSDGGKSSQKSLPWADRKTDKAESKVLEAVSGRSASAAAAVEEDEELPWDGGVMDETLVAEAIEAGVSEERGMNDGIWQEEMRKDRSSFSPPIEDEYIDGEDSEMEHGGQQSKAIKEIRSQVEEVEVDEAVQAAPKTNMRDTEESQLISTVEKAEADPGGTNPTAPEVALAAVPEVALAADPEEEPEEPEEPEGPEEPEESEHRHKAECCAEEIALHNEPGAENEAGDEAAELELHEEPEEAVDKGRLSADEDAELAEKTCEEETAEGGAAVEEAWDGALGGSSGSENEDENEASEDDEPCTAEQRDAAKQAKDAAKAAKRAKPPGGRGCAGGAARSGKARSSARVIKRPNTGFQLFSFERRAEFSEQLPGADSKEIMKLLSDAWKKLRSSARIQYNERAASVPEVGTAVLVRLVLSGTEQGELSGWQAGEVHALLQGASFLVEVEGEAGMLEMRVEEQGTAWRPAQDEGGDSAGDERGDEQCRRTAGKAKASSTAALAPAKKRAHLAPPSDQESSDADSNDEAEAEQEALLRQAQQMLADQAEKAARRERAKAKKMAAIKVVQQAVATGAAAEAMDEEAEAEAEAEMRSGMCRRGRTLWASESAVLAREEEMSPEPEAEHGADTPPIPLGGNDTGLQQVATACEYVQLAIGDHKKRRISEDAARAKQLLASQLEHSAVSVRAAETQAGPKQLEARLAEYRGVQAQFLALETAELEASRVRQHEERQMRGAAEKLQLATKELKRKLQTIGAEAHARQEQLEAEFKQQARLIKKKGKKAHQQKNKQLQELFALIQANANDDDDLDDDDDL